MYNGRVMTKRARQTTIRKIVRSRAVETQAQLLKALRKSGMSIDQATLSRDLAELGIRKASGRYRLSRSEKQEVGHLDLSGVVQGFLCCGPHLIVINTAVGQAQSVAVAIDAAQDSAIVATLGGDDTVFIATKNRRTQTVALRRLASWFGEKHEH